MEVILDNRYKGYDKYLSTHPGLYKSYDRASYEEAISAYRKRFLPFMPSVKNVNIIDLGCGQGYLLNWLKHEGYTNIKGVDISSEQIEFCKKHIHEPVVCIEAETYLSQTKEKYDIIFLTDVLELVPQDEVLGLLSEIYNHLNPKGRFFVQVPNMGNPFNLDARYCEFFHRNGFTAGSLKQALELTKFEIIHIGSESDKERFHKPRQFLRRIILFFIEKLFAVPFSGKNIGENIPLGRRIYAVAARKNKK